MTGFRIAYGGARERFDVVPDLTALGKVIGGGLPVAAYGGRARAHAAHCADRPGLSGRHAVGQSAGHGGGLATLDMLTRDLHDSITAQTARLVQGLRDVAARHERAVHGQSCRLHVGLLLPRRRR